MPAIKAVRAIVTGRVQGVGFRYATLSEGQQRNLTGWVRNLPSGQVEVLAQGPPATVDDFVEWLAIGPRPASVINVEVTPVEADTGLETFHVRF
ncbi:MAG: acylphosphatase [Thermoanaerobaculales bacterium]|nr:acylphosphatase [Thermoanaerobaculales bacterium]